MCGLQESDGTVFINPARYIYIFFINSCADGKPLECKIGFVFKNHKKKCSIVIAVTVQRSVKAKIMRGRVYIA